MFFLKSDRIKGYFQLFLVIAFIAFSLLVNSFLQAKRVETFSKNEKKESYVQVIDAKKQNKRLELNLSGVFKAKSEINIVPQISGRVINVHEDFYQGGVFNKDQLLFEIEPQDYILEVHRLEAEVKKAETAYDIERAEAKAALLEWYQLHPNHIKAPDLVVRKPQLREALANLRGAMSSLKNAQLDLERSKFRFPFSGRILESSIHKGQYVSAGQSYGRVYDVQSMEIESAVSDSQAVIFARSDKDIKVTISAQYLGEKYEYPGILKRAFSEYEQNTRFGRIIFAIQGQCSNKLFPGIFAKINVVGKEEKDVMVLPVSVLQNGNKIWHVVDHQLEELQADILSIDDQNVIIKTSLDQAKVVAGKFSGGFSGMKVKFDEVVNEK